MKWQVLAEVLSQVFIENMSTMQVRRKRILKITGGEEGLRSNTQAPPLPDRQAVETFLFHSHYKSSEYSPKY